MTSWTDDETAARAPLRRVLDLSVACTGLLVSAPVLGLAAAAIWLDDGGPVFFRQRRVGRGAVPFTMLKLRTMRHAPVAQGPHFSSAADRRITRVGHWLRKSKIDELPQLWNVLRGDMGVVGPRPETCEYFERYSPAAKRIARHLPGVTDPASVLFRWEGELLERVDDPERFYWQVIVPAKAAIAEEYGKRADVLSDLQVLARTVRALLTAGEPPEPEAIRQCYAPTAEPFSVRKPSHGESVAERDG